MLIAGQDSELPAGFCDFITNLHCSPASSGSVKRVFSALETTWVVVFFRCYVIFFNITTNVY